MMKKVLLFTLASLMMAACGNKSESSISEADGGIFGSGGAELVKYNIEQKALEDAERAYNQNGDYDSGYEKLLLKKLAKWKDLDERKAALAETLIGIEVPTAVSEATPASILQPFTVKGFDVKKESGISMIRLEGTFELKEDLPAHINILGEDENGNLKWEPQNICSTSHSFLNHPDFDGIVPAGSKVTLYFSIQVYTKTFEDVFAVKRFVLNWLPIDEGMDS